MYDKKFLEYQKYLKQLARNNRKNPTKAELLFWNMIVRKDRFDYRFLRQKPIDNYIIDFYCFKLKLAIEIDGDTHDLKDENDFQRDINLKNIGIKTIRYSNEQVLYQLENVYYDLDQRIKEIINPQSPSEPAPLQKEH